MIKKCPLFLIITRLNVHFIYELFMDLLCTFTRISPKIPPPAIPNTLTGKTWIFCNSVAPPPFFAHILQSSQAENMWKLSDNICPLPPFLPSYLILSIHWLIYCSKLGTVHITQAETFCCCYSVDGTDGDFTGLPSILLYKSPSSQPPFY